MYKEIYKYPPNLDWGKIYTPKKHPGRRQRQFAENVFQCHHCKAYVYTQPAISGVQNRNHCPFCLWSLHVDYFRAGDRMSACKAIMQPIGLTVKPGRNKYGRLRYGELMLIHRCSDCGKISINRVAADDLPDQLMEIFYSSSGLDEATQLQLEVGGIRLLQGEDLQIVASQLVGATPN